MEKFKKITTNLLIAFALISFGVMLGKNSVKPIESSVSKSNDNNGNYVAVYYLHSTFRCVTCNTIEKLTINLLNSSYKNKLSNGEIKWQEIDFQENEAIAHKFNVIASCVVVGLVKNGEFVEYERMDDVWELVNKPTEFYDHVSKVIDANLEKIEINE
ncbi:MAG: hypothetical protein JXQ65_14170 [Candidatus Marinimicrobia bacterium]|nr:hypothetical protein [Candidatus Neomarinimicrobiota bacterium]